MRQRLKQKLVRTSDEALYERRHVQLWLKPLSLFFHTLKDKDDNPVSVPYPDFFSLWHIFTRYRHDYC